MNIEQFLKIIRDREPRLYESSTRSVDLWNARKKLDEGHRPVRKKPDDTVAPDGHPYTLGPKVPKVSLTEIISEYEKDLAS